MVQRLKKDDIISRLNSVDELPMLPDIVMKLNSIMQNADFCLKDLTDLIEKDQSMVTKLLRIVNSSFFGFSSRISTVNHAIVILGLNTVRNALLTGSVIDSMPNISGVNGFNIKDFWIHSISVAVVSTHLGERANIHFPDDCFTAGLLHDIGKLVLEEHFKDEFLQILRIIKEERLDFFSAERKVMEKGHDFIGAYLARKWELPEHLIRTIMLHHRYLLSDEYDSFVSLIYLSDYIVHCLKRGDFEIPELPFFDTEDGKRLKKEVDSIPDWIDDVSGDIESACRVLIA